MSTVTKTSPVAQAVQQRRHQQRVEALATYRKFIEANYAGKKLTEADTAKVVDAMNLLGIPTEAIDADVAAWDRHLNYRKSLDEIPAKREKLQPELERLTTLINKLQTELRQAERDHRIKCHEGTSIVALESQANSFRGQHPRLFSDDVDRACAPPREALEFSPRPPSDAAPVPYFSTH